jgi:hypothetical protein
MKNNAILASTIFLLIAVEGWAQLPETLLKTTPVRLRKAAVAS